MIPYSFSIIAESIFRKSIVAINFLPLEPDSTFYRFQFSASRLIYPKEMIFCASDAEMARPLRVSFIEGSPHSKRNSGKLYRVASICLESSRKSKIPISGRSVSRGSTHQKAAAKRYMKDSTHQHFRITFEDGKFMKLRLTTDFGDGKMSPTGTRGSDKSPSTPNIFGKAGHRQRFEYPVHEYDIGGEIDDDSSVGDDNDLEEEDREHTACWAHTWSGEEVPSPSSSIQKKQHRTFQRLENISETEIRSLFECFPEIIKNAFALN